MTFKLNQQTIANRRYGSAIAFSVSSGPVYPYLATQVQTGTQWYSAFCASAYGNGYRQRSPGNGNCYHLYYNDEWFPGDNVLVPTYEYTCPQGGVYDGSGNCVEE